PAPRPGQRGPLRRGLEPSPPGGPALGLSARADHARGADEARRPGLAHDAAAQRSIVERLGDGLGNPAALEDALGDPEALLSDLITPEQRNISSALTAQTTAIGAYVDHITAGIAETLTSSPAALREAWYRYRIEEGKGEQAFAGLFGLDVGQDEVDRGRAFVRGVIERAGEDALARLWGDELDLPTPAEVDAPGL